MKNIKGVTMRSFSVVLDSFGGGISRRIVAMGVAFCLTLGLTFPASALTTDATYYGKVGRILQNKCVQCHHVGGAAPFSMQTYADTQPWAADMKNKVFNHLMPPWNANHDQGFPLGQGFVGDRSLTQEEIDLIINWADGGAPAGDPTDAPPQKTYNDDWENGTPDLVLTQPVPWTLNPGDPEIYRCFVLKTGFTQDMTISGLEVQPSNAKIAHHAILFYDPYNNAPAVDAADGGPNDGWTCFGDSGVPGAPGLGGWAPGGNTQPFSDKLGVTIPAGSNIIIQMHYSNINVGVTPETDQTRIGLKFTNNPNVIQLIQVPPTRLDFSIPPHFIGYEVPYSFYIPFDVHLVAVFPHMHLHGRLMEVTATPPGQLPFSLIDVNKWSFSWQNHYIYDQPIALPAGTVVNFTGTYDNNSDQTVNGGYTSTEEMLLLGLTFTSDAPIPGLGGGGIPENHDSTPPTLVTTAVEQGSTIFKATFSEPIQPPNFPSDVDFHVSGGGARVTPDDISVDGNTLTVTFNNLPLGYYTAQINGFFGVKDLAGNYLDGNGNGIGGELADDRSIEFNNYVAPMIVRQTPDQSVNLGEDVIFAVEADGSPTLTYQWYKTDFQGPAPIGGATSPSYEVSNASFFDSAFYKCVVTNGAGSATSVNAALTVYQPAKSNSAQFVSHTIPAEMLPGQTAPGSVTMKDTSAVSWSNAQGYALAILSDPAQLFGGATSILFASDVDVAVVGSGKYAFTGNMTAPVTPGTYNVQFQMVQNGSSFFGPIVSANVTVGSFFDVSFSNSTQGWYAGVLAGTGTTAANATGLCMSVGLPGDNIVGWASPPGYLPLVDNAVYRVTLGLWTNQTAADQIPLFSFSFNNYYPGGQGNVYGGDAWILDNVGGAEGIGRAQGRTSYVFYVAPNAMLTPQWRGLVDSSNSAFDPSIDPYNDIGLVVREVDLGSQGYGATNDSGMICLTSLKAEQFSFSTLTSGSTRVWNPAINTATHAAQTYAQAGEGTGTAFIDNGTATANYALRSGDSGDSGGLGARKTLLPFDPTQADYYAQLYPVTWAQNQLYMGSIKLRSTVNGGAGPEGTDPVDAVFLHMDTGTEELGQSFYTTRGSPSNMHYAASPRLASTTGGTGQQYVVFFHGQNATLSGITDANRLRLMAEFQNSMALADGLGLDPLRVDEMAIDQLVSPP